MVSVNFTYNHFDGQEQTILSNDALYISETINPRGDKWNKTRFERNKSENVMKT